MSVPVYYGGAWAGNRYVYDRVGKGKKVCRRLAPNFIKQVFAHHGLKPCRCYTGALDVLA